MTEVDQLLRTKDLCDALAVWAADLLPELCTAVYAWDVPPEAVAPFVLLGLRPGEKATVPMTRFATHDLHVLAWSCGRTIRQAVSLGDLVRGLFLEQQPSGAYTADLDDILDGIAVLQRGGGDDAIPDTVEGVPQVSEGFVLTLGRGSVSEPGP